MYLLVSEGADILLNARCLVGTKWAFIFPDSHTTGLHNGVCVEN